MIPVAVGIYKALEAVELGLLAFPKVWDLIQLAQSEGRDLTNEELEKLDIRTDTAHGNFTDAVNRQADREAADGE